MHATLRRFLAIGLIIAAWPSPALAAETATDNPRRTALDMTVAQAADAFFAPGCHVGLSLVVHVQGGDHFYNYGSVSRERAALPTKDTIYEIGSLTKTFVGTLAAMAVEERRMALDGAVTSYLDGAYPGLSYESRAVQVRDIVTHSSALPAQVPDVSAILADPDRDRVPERLIEAERSFDRSAYLGALAQASLGRRPGERFEYSNFGPKVLGFALEDVYGAGLSILMRRKLTRPLGMRSTDFAVSIWNRRRLAIPYSASGRRQPYHLENIGAAGGLYSTTADLARYLAYHLREEPAAALTHQALLPLGDSVAMGMFWYLADAPVRRVWQSGGMFGMSSQMMFYPDEGFGAALLANDGCPDTQGQLYAFAEAVRVGVMQRD